MSLDLNELLKKAKSKGIVSDITTFTKPWHQEALVINPVSDIEEFSNQQYKPQAILAQNIANQLNDKGVSENNLRKENLQPIEFKKENAAAEITHKSPKIITDKEQTGNNWGTNREQLGNKQGTIGEQSREQTGNNWGTNREQLGNKQGTIGEQSREQTGNNWGTNREQFREQNGLNCYRDVSHAVNALAGLQNNLFFYLIENCSLNGTLDTSKVTNEELESFLNCSSESAKITIKRLIKKGLLKRKVGKKGRSGFTIFTFDELVRKIGIEVYNRSPKDKTGNNWITKQGTMKNSSSSLDLNYITTDYSSTAPEYPCEFDLEPLSDIGFTLNHAKQILKQGKLTSEEIQESIHHFAFDLTHNDKLKTIKTNALAFFMGTLKKGDYYNPSSNYESQKVRNMRLLLQAKIKREAQEKEIEEKLKESDYKDWIENLPNNELMEFYLEEQDISNVPEKIKKTLIRRNALNNARQYFDSEIWPQKKKEIETQSLL